MTMPPIHAFVALMRRYCIDYTNVHDLDIIEQLMTPEYVVRSSGWELPFSRYRRTVAKVFERFPTLGLTVHEIITNGERLALRFSEHGASAAHGGAVAVWPGISLYTWDGQRLVTCAVEQDFLARDRQLVAGVTDAVEAPHPDPWVTQPVAANAAAEQLVRTWLTTQPQDRAPLEGSTFTVLHDDGRDPVAMEAATVTVDDLFSAGDRVAARFTTCGRYAGGLPGVAADRAGTTVELHATALATVGDDGLRDVRVIHDRWGLRQRLAATATE